MKSFLSHLRGSAVSLLIFATVLCGLYPLAVRAVAVLAFPDQAEGSLLRDSAGRVRGSRLIGQQFTGSGWFHPRPSAAGPDGYDAASSGGSNLGPTSQKLADLIRSRAAAWRAANGLAEGEPVPADAVTASGSGLDPHISPRNAELQAPRVAAARGLPLPQVRDLIRTHTAGRSLRLLGEPGVNVLELNLALATLKP